jgi:putative membrane protein
MAAAPENDPRIYFAAERTFLAWIRTGLALMGVGFAVSRFGLFLRQLLATEVHQSTRQSHYSVLTGAGLVVLGVIINLAATFHHVRLTRQLATGTWMPGRVSRQAVALSLLLALVGIGMAAYLLIVR